MIQDEKERIKLIPYITLVQMNIEIARRQFEAAKAYGMGAVEKLRQALQAREHLKKMERRMDLTIPENLQFIRQKRLCISCIQKESDPYHAIEESIEILQNIISHTQESSVDGKYHFILLGSVGITLTQLLHQCKRYEEELEYIDQTITYIMRCGYGKMIPALLQEKVKVQKKLGSKEEQIRKDQACYDSIRELL